MPRVRSFSIISAALILSAAFVLSGCGSRGSAQSTFSNASIKGSYALSFAVAIGGTTGTSFAAGTGVIVADGVGDLSGSESFSVTSGSVCTGLALSGTYTINPDGTGTALINYTSSSNPKCTGSLTQILAIADGGQVVKTANVNTNVAQLSGDWTRQ